MAKPIAEPTFPSVSRYWQGIYWLALAGLLLRFAFALVSDNVHHPDEIFQYLEPAHRLVFGYGIIPWEYRFGTRSWLIPFVISAPLYVCKILHIDDPALYIPLIKFIFCLASTSLIFSGYAIGRSLVSEAAGKLAAVLCCFWYELIYFSFRPLADVVSTYFLVGALACAVTPENRRKPYLFGFLAAMSAVLRIHYAPAIGLIVLLAAFTWNKKRLLNAAIASVGVVVCAGWIDCLMWGGWFASYYNNYLFNSVYGVSKLFGEKDSDWYFEQISIASMGVFVLTFLFSFIYIKRLWPLVVCTAVLIGEHSLFPHKEYRFVFATIPLFLVLIAAFVVLVSDEFLSASWTSRARWMAALSLVTISVAGILNWLPDENSVYRRTPLYAPDPVLQASHRLHDETDLSGVLITSMGFQATGGYYYLHRDVPIYFSSDWWRMSQDDDGPGPTDYVSHIVCDSSTEEIAGFSEAGRFGSLEIRRQPNPPAQRLMLPSYSRHIYHHEIDGKYERTVKPLAIDNDPR